MAAMAIPTSFWLQAYVRLGQTEKLLLVDVGNYATLSQAQEKALDLMERGFCKEREDEGEVVMMCYPPHSIYNAFIIKTQ